MDLTKIKVEEDGVHAAGSPILVIIRFDALIEKVVDRLIINP